MKLLIHFKGEGREITVPEPSAEEKKKLLEFAIRVKLKGAVDFEHGGLHLGSSGAIWETVRDTVVEWSLNGYYPKEKEHAEKS